MKHVGDITKLNGAELEPVWCITGGSPCQDLSVAGKRAGLAGARSGLFMEQVRLVKEMRENDKRNGRTGDMVRPRYMVWENVPGAFSSNFSDGFGDFGAVLEEVIRVAEPTFSLPRLEGKQKWTKSGAIDGDGWSVAWRTHDAQYWGVPQRRRRISLVADFGGSSAGEILFERESLSGNPEQSEPQRKETAGDFAESTGVHDRVAVPKLGILNPADSQGNQAEDGISATPKTSGPGAVVVGVDGYNAAVTGDVSSSLGVNCGMSTGRNGVCYAIDQQGGKGMAGYGVNVCPTLASDSHGTPHAVAYGINCSGGADAQVDTEKIGCITAAANSSGNNKAAVAYEKEVPYTLKIRGGVDKDSNGKAAGKGALIQTDLSATLGVSQDQTLFQPIATDRSAYNQGKNALFGSQYLEDGTAQTIIARDPGAVAYAMPSEPTLASGKETTGCLMASGYDKLGAQEMFSGDYTVVEPKMLDGSDVCPTLTTNNAGGNQRMPDKDNFNAVCYGISSYESNAMKSANPNSGIYEADTSRTIDVSGGNPACNQGGVAVCEPVACLETFHCTAEENMTQPLKARDYKDPLCVAYAEPAWNGKCDGAEGNGVSFAVTGDHDNRPTDMTNIVVSDQKSYCIQGSMIGRADKNGPQGDGVNEEVSFTQNATDRHGVAYRTIRWIVRRLTPLECTRLQGFPDGWIEIGEWVDSEGKKHKDADSPKYKALGNSIALPFWYWMFCRMAKYLPRDATLGSLFDGIGGFPICWEAIHGRGTARWASEIEEFPIAVTKMRFGED